MEALVADVMSNIKKLPKGLNSPQRLIEAAMDKASGNISVHSAGLSFDVSPVYGSPLTLPIPDHPGQKGLNVLGILYQHANTMHHSIELEASSGAH